MDGLPLILARKIKCVVVATMVLLLINIAIPRGFKLVKNHAHV